MENVSLYEKEMLKYMERNYADIIEKIEEKQALDETLETEIKNALTAFEKEFQNMIEG